MLPIIEFMIRVVGLWGRRMSLAGTVAIAKRQRYIEFCMGDLAARLCMGCSASMGCFMLYFA